MKNVADIYALSPMQQLMLLHARTAVDAHDVLFNQVVYELNGRLDQEAYRRAWQLMVERHAALRTMFVWQDRKDPVQVVREQAALPWEDHDWSHLSPAEQDGALDTLLAGDQAQGFDLLRPPLMRLILICLGGDRHWLVWSSHHLIIDRWCIDILFEEVGLAYAAYAAGGAPALSPAPRYRDYIAWLAAQDPEAAKAFWREALQGSRARPLPLKTAVHGETADLHTLRTIVDGHPWTAIRRFALDNNVTPGTLVAAAWALVLASISGVDNALFGLTVSGRPAELPEVARTVGCFINNVPLRLALDGEMPLVAWLQAVRDQQLALQPYEYVSPAQIQLWTGLKSGGPLFESLLVLQAPARQEPPQGLDVRFVHGGMQTGYPVSLGAVPAEESLRLSLTYHRRRLSPSLAGQMLVALQQILLAFPDWSGATLADLRAGLRLEIGPSNSAEPAPAAVAREHAPAEWNYMPPRTAAEQALAPIWAEALNLPHVSVEDRFFDLGGDSISAIQLLTLVEERLGTRLPVSLLFGNPSVIQMAEQIDEETAVSQADPIVLPINREGTRPPLFFLHGIFGDVSYLTNLVMLLPKDQPLYGLQDPGLRSGEIENRTLEEIAAQHVAAIRRVQPGGPYHLVGFCFGGVLAYEVARQLEQLGERTALLAIIEGSTPPELYNRRPIYSRERLQVIGNSAPYWIRGNKELGGWRLRERITSRLGRGAKAGNGQANGGTDLDNLADYDAMRPQSQFRLRELNKRAIEAYVPAWYGGQVTLIRARNLHLGHALFGGIDPERGWGRVAHGGVAIRYVNGSHVGVLKWPHVADLAKALIEALDESVRETVR